MNLIVLLQRKVIMFRSMLVVLVALIVGSGCASVPPSLSSPVVFRANEASDRVQRLQLGAIAINGAGIGVLSDANTRVVVDAVAEGLPVVQKAPDGWKPTVAAILERISTRLDDAGKMRLATYLRLIEAFLGGTFEPVLRDVFPGPLPTDAEMKVVFDLTISHALADGARWTATHPRP